jgi:hypothetical protein
MVSDSLVAVYLTSAVRTSARPGPGVRRVPPAEAASLVARKHARYGESAPRGFDDGGADALGVARMMPRG